jgi:oligopeptide/dipeptide ABC transporter ATP-binding protein
MQIVFQDPTDSLDPRMLVKKIVAEPLECQKLLNPTEIQERLQQIMETVGLSKQHYNRYPHEFSGGQRQRIAVARALTTHPDLILMDEPTSALDVSVQSQILNLLKGLQKQFNLTYIFVTHHLLVVKFISDRIAVMYLGKIVEIGKTKTVFENANHPYTRALLSAIPVPDPEIEKERIVLEGDVPNPINPPNGCRFHPRCQYAADICKKELPVMESIDETDHSVACHRWKEIY